MKDKNKKTLKNYIKACLLVLILGGYFIYLFFFRINFRKTIRKKILPPIGSRYLNQNQDLDSSPLPIIILFIAFIIPRSILRLKKYIGYSIDFKKENPNDINIYHFRIFLESLKIVILTVFTVFLSLTYK